MPFCKRKDEWESWIIPLERFHQYYGSTWPNICKLKGKIIYWLQYLYIVFIMTKFLKGKSESIFIDIECSVECLQNESQTQKIPCSALGGNDICGTEKIRRAMYFQKRVSTIGKTGRFPTSNLWDNVCASDISIDNIYRYTLQHQHGPEGGVVCSSSEEEQALQETKIENWAIWHQVTWIDSCIINEEIVMKECTVYRLQAQKNKNKIASKHL